MDIINPQDMDLIDILWQQDIDMGVCRAAFDGTLQKELEKEDFKELCKKGDEDEGCVCDEEPVEDQPPIVYARDDETGEMVASSQVSDFSELNLESEQRNQQQDVLFEDAISILQGVVASDNPTVQRNNSIETFDLRSLLEDSSMDLSLSRQVSLENRWMDIETFITGNGSQTTRRNASFFDGGSSEFDGPLRPIFNNATLGVVPEIPENLTSVSVLQPTSYNSSEPPVPMGSQWVDGLFPEANLTSISNETERLLQEVLQSEVENLQLISINGSELEAEMRAENCSDSAFGSISGSSPREEWRNSPTYDGVEGATGGSDSDAKHFKFYSSSESSFTPTQNGYAYSNASSDSNTTDFRETVLASPFDVAHNHTYTAVKPERHVSKKRPVKPPSEQKDPTVPLTRDEKKLKSLNIRFTMSQIIESPVEEFNDMLTRHKFSTAQLQLIKDIRRRGKNKVAAQNCRKRKIEVIQTLEEQVVGLRRQREALAAEQQNLAAKHDESKSKYQQLYDQVLNAQVDEDGRPYSSEYRLQHMHDGSVFLVPIGSAMTSEPEDEPAEEEETRGRRKRKSKK